MVIIRKKAENWRIAEANIKNQPQKRDFQFFKLNLIQSNTVELIKKEKPRKTIQLFAVVGNYFTRCKEIRFYAFGAHVQIR